jgi:hypothetical protein
VRVDLQQFIVALSGINNVWWANGDQVFTGRPLITLQLTSQDSNNPTYGAPDEDGDILVHQDQLVTLSMQYYDSERAGSAFDKLVTLRNKLELISSQQTLRAAGFSYVQVLQDVTDAPALAGTTWESRAVLDIQLRALVQQSDTIGLIERVEIEGTINGDINVNSETEV